MGSKEIKFWAIVFPTIGYARLGRWKRGVGLLGLTVAVNVIGGALGNVLEYPNAQWAFLVGFFVGMGLRLFQTVEVWDMANKKFNTKEPTIKKYGPITWDSSK